MTQIHQHRFDNGLVLLAEPVPGAQSLAMSLLTPAGLATEPAGQEGVAAVLAEMMLRGAGKLDAKAHSDALDQLGVQRGTSAETNHLHVGGTMIGSKLREAAPLILDMVLRPMLPENAMEPARDLALQSLASLDDEPQQKVFIELRKRHYPEPFGRSPLGQKKDIESLKLADVRKHWQAKVVPGGSVIGFAGKFDWSQLRDQVGELTRDWTGALPEPTPGQPPSRGYTHENAQTTQVHIGLAYDAPPETNEESILQRAAAAVLSGGMSGRLFTEVREKRGLCYSVYASYAGQKTRGAMLSYAGTTAPRAQETLDVLTGELRRLSKGVEKAEFERAIVGMKSRLVMQGESTGARAHAIAVDQYMFGRPRTLDELIRRVDAVTLERLDRYVKEHPPGPMTLVTIGPAQLRP
jgi:predicted Zn-dependent peptidase